MSISKSIDKEVQLWALLHRTSDALSKARSKELRGSGISAMQVAVIFFTNIIDGVATPGEISRWLFRESHTISELLRRMEKKGLIKKFKHTTKKNVVGIRITEKGNRMYEEAMKRESIKGLISTLSSEEQEQLSFLLSKLLNEVLLTLDLKRKLPWF